MTMRLGEGFDERIPLVLVLDTSESMARPNGSPRIAELNAALGEWLRDARTKPSLRGSVEVAFVTFGSVVQVLDPATGEPAAEQSADTAFALVDNVRQPDLRTGGLTLLLPAIELALDLAVRRVRLLASRGVPARRPRIWLVTDGAPSTVTGERAAEHPDTPGEGCLFYVIGVGNADRDTLEVLAPDSTMMLGSVRFSDILALVSNSTDSASSGDEPEQAYRETRDNAAMIERFRSLEERFLDR
jgi:uncharacterized protein YegL